MAAGFVTEVPETVRARLSDTNETAGTFTMTRTLPSGEKFVTSGDYLVRPGVDFTWRTKTPFATCFYATPERYVYTNEDERVERRLEDLPHLSRFKAAAKGDYSAFFDAFDALYKEEGGLFHFKAKPKVDALRRVLERVDGDGGPGFWRLKASFTDKSSIDVEFKDSK